MKYSHDGSIWDNLPTPMKWIVGIGATLYFGGGLIVPFFWSF
jgi:hypothetical protein